MSAEREPIARRGVSERAKPDESHAFARAGHGHSFTMGAIADKSSHHEQQVFPNHRTSHPLGPGVEVQEDPVERRRRDGEEMDSYTSLE